MGSSSPSFVALWIYYRLFWIFFALVQPLQTPIIIASFNSELFAAIFQFTCLVFVGHQEF